MPFQKNNRANPGGRTREQRRRETELSEAIGKLAGPGFERYLKRLDDIAMNGEDRDSIRALEILIERRHGRSPEFIHVEGAGQFAPLDLSVLTREERDLVRKLAVSAPRQLAQDTEH